MLLDTLNFNKKKSKSGCVTLQRGWSYGFCDPEVAETRNIKEFIVILTEILFLRQRGTLSSWENIPGGVANVWDHL